MDIVGRLCPTLIGKHGIVKAFQRNALQLLLGMAWFAFADLSRAGDTKTWEEFSGEKALTHVQRLVDLGPRPAGSDAIEKARNYIEDELRHSGWQVTRQAFSDDTPRGKINFVNLIARLSSDGNAASPSFLLCSHYDTKLFDTFRFVGANDGGSSTGLLLELARVLGHHPSVAKNVELVFFDGEEAYENFSQTDGLYGSRYFARQLQSEGTKQPARSATHRVAGGFRGGILFDMVGDRSLGVTLPADSPAAMARDVFTAAEALKFRKYFSYLDRDMIDDHTPLNAIGIPTIDIIDFDYPWWHTADDTMDKISAQSLQIVGSVALYYLAEFGFKPRVASIKKDTEGKIIFDEEYLCCWRATEQTSQTAGRRSRRLFSCAPAANARLCRSSAQRPDLMAQDGPELAFDGVLQSKWI